MGQRRVVLITAEGPITRFDGTSLLCSQVAMAADLGGPPRVRSRGARKPHNFENLGSNPVFRTNLDGDISEAARRLAGFFHVVQSLPLRDRSLRQKTFHYQCIKPLPASSPFGRDAPRASQSGGGHGVLHCKKLSQHGYLAGIARQVVVIAWKEVRVYSDRGTHDLLTLRVEFGRRRQK
jgi:hypothetical protein